MHDLFKNSHLSIKSKYKIETFSVDGWHFKPKVVHRSNVGLNLRTINTWQILQNLKRLKLTENAGYYQNWQRK